MMYYEALYLLSIVLMIFVIFIVSSMIASMPFSLYTCVIRAIRMKFDCLTWLLNNPRFIMYHVFIVSIIGIGLSNLGQMVKDDIFTRTVFVQHAGPILWMCLMYIMFDYKRVTDLLNAKK